MLTGPDDVAQAQELRVAIGRVARRMRQIYAQTEAGVSFTEVAVLVRLNRDGPTTPGALAGQEKVTSQAIAAVLRGLAEQGLVDRSPDPSDGRRAVVTITGAGRALLADREQTVLSGLVRALAECRPADRRRLLGAVPLLNQLADAL